MSNSQLQAVASANQTSDLNSELLHHLVDFTRVFKKTASDPEVQALIKKNNELINKLLLGPLTALSLAPAAAAAPNAPVAAVTVPADWKELLVKKLTDSQVDLADAKVKEHANKQVETTAKQIDGLIDALVRNATSFGRIEDKVIFEIDPKTVDLDAPFKQIFLRGLTFEVSLYTAPIDLSVICTGIPEGKSSKVRAEVTIKNHIGQRDIVRHCSKVLSKLQTNATGVLSDQLDIFDLVLPAEYEDQSLGFLKDGKLVVEVTVRADELTDYTPPAAGAYDPITGAYNDFVDIYDDGL